MKKRIYLVLLLFLLSVLSGCFYENTYINQLKSENDDLVDKIEDIKGFVNSASTKAMKSNVTVYYYTYNFNPDRINTKPTSISQGSGVIFEKSDNNYYVLTNAHVLKNSKNAPFVKVEISDYLGNNYQCIIHNIDEDLDLAVIAFAGNDTNLDLLELALSNPVKDDIVIAIGQPSGQINTLTIGKVKGYGFVELENDKTFNFQTIIHDAPISSGSSGGVLINQELQIIGINFAASKNSDINLSYSIPIEVISNYLIENSIIVKNK